MISAHANTTSPAFITALCPPTVVFSQRRYCSPCNTAATFGLSRNLPARKQKRFQLFAPPPPKVRTCQSQSAYRGFASTLVCPANVFLYPPLWATKYWGAWTRTLWLASWQGCLCLAAGLRCTLPLLVQALPQPRRNLPGEATGRKRLCLTIYTTRLIGSQLEPAAIYDQGRELVGTVSTCVPSMKASSLS